MLYLNLGHELGAQKTHQHKDPKIYDRKFLVSPLRGALEPECEILMIMWSVEPYECWLQ